MKKSTVTALITLLLVPQLMLSGCKSKSEQAKTDPEAHQKEMMKRSFEESKKATAVKVNGEAVSEFFVVREMNAIAPRSLPNGRQRTPEIDKKIRTDALNIVVFEQLAVQEAKKRGMKASPELIKGEMEKIRQSAGSESGFQKYLVENGLTEAELRAVIEQDALFEMIAAEEIDAKIKVTDAELRARYKKEKAGLKDARHREMTYEEAKSVLDQRMRSERAEKRMREWEKTLKKNALIEIAGRT